jgi:hypothetical protein
MGVSLHPAAGYRRVMDITTPAPVDRSATISIPPTGDFSSLAAHVFRRVWRTSLDEPGFAVLRFERAVTSKELRRAMCDLYRAMPVQFVPERLGRFDQQVSSRFHRDGAPPASLLLLGYEPSTVGSRLFVADAHRAAVAAGLEIGAFLAAHNPMFPVGETKLGPFVTELVAPRGESYIVAMNNSLMPLDGGKSNPLGLLHKAIVTAPDPTGTRVINSIGLMVAGDPAGTPKSAADLDHFLTRDDLD